MKKAIYTTAELEIVRFDTEDVITASIPTGGSGDGDSGAGNWGPLNG
ncbi:MAG: hypothetical protein IJ779_03975 [Ruminococcus sp.]|nr:hypothetical protein [Ruminococcus sp.]